MVECIRQLSWMSMILQLGVKKMSIKMDFKTCPFTLKLGTGFIFNNNINMEQERDNPYLNIYRSIHSRNLTPRVLYHQLAMAHNTVGIMIQDLFQIVQQASPISQQQFEHLPHNLPPAPKIPSFSERLAGLDVFEQDVREWQKRGLKKPIQKDVKRDEKKMVRVERKDELRQKVLKEDTKKKPKLKPKKKYELYDELI